MLSIKPERKPEPGTGRMFDDYWAPSVKLLSDMKFLDKLKAYEKDNIPPPTIKRIREKYEQPNRACYTVYRGRPPLPRTEGAYCRVVPSVRSSQKATLQFAEMLTTLGFNDITLGFNDFPKTAAQQNPCLDCPVLLVRKVKVPGHSLQKCLECQSCSVIVFY